MSDSEIKAGDVVQLRSGGPAMTVCATGVDSVECAWFVPGGEARFGAFSVTSLKRYGGSVERERITTEPVMPARPSSLNEPSLDDPEFVAMAKVFKELGVDAEGTRTALAIALSGERSFRKARRESKSHNEQFLASLSRELERPEADAEGKLYQLEVIVSSEQEYRTSMAALNALKAGVPTKKA